MSICFPAEDFGIEKHIFLGLTEGRSSRLKRRPEEQWVVLVEQQMKEQNLA
jgi:hypothetical protein